MVQLHPMPSLTGHLKVLSSRFLANFTRKPSILYYPQFDQYIDVTSFFRRQNLREPNLQWTTRNLTHFLTRIPWSHQCRNHLLHHLPRFRKKIMSSLALLCSASIACFSEVSEDFGLTSCLLSWRGAALGWGLINSCVVRIADDLEECVQLTWRTDCNISCSWCLIHVLL